MNVALTEQWGLDRLAELAKDAVADREHKVNKSRALLSTLHHVKTSASPAKDWGSMQIFIDKWLTEYGKRLLPGIPAAKQKKDYGLALIKIYLQWKWESLTWSPST